MNEDTEDTIRLAAPRGEEPPATVDTHPLAGLHAVVTGGSRGIGFAVAKALAGMGASLTLLGRDRERLYSAISELPGTTCDTQVCDVGDEGAVARAFAAVARNRRPLAVLVNNAGASRSAKFARTDRVLWEDMLRVNLTGAYLCTQAAMPLLLAAPWARVVNVASTAGLVGYANVTAYCAAKHGLIGLTRALAQELAPSRVTVNAVCPGYTDTALARDAVSSIVMRTGRSEQEARGALAVRNPQGRLVTPAEVAASVAWLCTPAAQAITGQAIVVAGGEVMAG
jgi:NAD(P)-dependent dehydrogenase (short-subunit alcohol dehydrogenase family)